jgi:hypothetical protein
MIMRKINFFLFIVLLIGLTTDLNAQTWIQIGSDIDGEAAGDYSGKSVDIDSTGSIVAIGAYGNYGNGFEAAGHARIYENQSVIWTQIGNDIDGDAANDYSGSSISLSADGSIVAIGAHGNDDNGSSAGQVRIYENLIGTWTQIGSDINGEAAGDYSGSSLSLSSDGSVVAIGAYGNDGNGTDAGHVCIYKNQLGTWTQIGSDIDGEVAGDQSGGSVSLSADGSIVAIGARLNDDAGNNAGHVRIYENIAGIWTQIGSDIDGDEADNYSGSSISLSSDGSIVAIGARYNDGSGTDAGHVRIYENLSGTWTQIGSNIDGEAAGDHSGVSVSLNSDGSILAIGAPYNGDAGSNSGHVRIYENLSGTWTQKGGDIDGEAVGDESGRYVSLNSDGSVVAVDAYFNDGNGNNAGHVRLFNYTCNSYANINPIACDSYTVPSGDETYTANGVYYDTIPNAIGCDSILTINLTINYSNTGIDVRIACSSYTWIDGNTYTSNNNTATQTLTNINGCDSVVTLDLTINYSNTGTGVITACDSYTWIDGNTYTSSNNTATHYLTNVNGCDSVVTLDLTINYSNSGTDVITACDSYTWIDGNTYTLSNNTATHTLTNLNGCDSVLTLDLTINTVNISVAENDITLTANESGASYQWIDCNDNNNPISGETSQSFTATENGSYAVIVDNGLCVDTSTCYTITGVGINDIRNGSINIYPNPTSGIIEIDLADNKINKISIADISGRKIIEKLPTNRNETLDLSRFESGLYIIMFETDKEIYISKILKE